MALKNVVCDQAVTLLDLREELKELHDESVMHHDAIVAMRFALDIPIHVSTRGIPEFIKERR